jgi:hypothetical protein
MEISRAVKRVFDTRNEGSRTFGRPKLRWEKDVIKEDRYE